MVMYVGMAMDACMAMYGQECLCMAIYGYVSLYMAMHV